MQAKTILFIVDHLIGGGAERVTLDLCQQLQNQGHHVSVACINGSKNRMTTPPDLQIIDLNLPELNAFGKLWKKKSLNKKQSQHINQIIQDINPDAIIIGFWNGHWLSKYINHPTTYHWIHGELLDIKPTYSILSRLKESIRFFRHARMFKTLFSKTNIIIVNDELKTKYTKLIPTSTIHVLQNGVSSHNQNLAKKFPLKKWDAIYVGRLSVEKQPLHAITAFLHSQLSGNMLIVGDGGLMQDLVSFVHQHNVTDRITFLGWVHQPHELIAQSKCLVLSSRTEGSPLVTAEALMIGTPIVAYECCDGISQQLHDPEMTIGLVAAQDTVQLAKALSIVAQHPYTISEDAQYHVSIQRMANQFLSIIR
jgi:glycosyltransferase involved in cell wall biosynthesis